MKNETEYKIMNLKIWWAMNFIKQEQNEDKQELIVRLRKQEMKDEPSQLKRAVEERWSPETRDQ